MTLTQSCINKNINKIILFHQISSYISNYSVAFIQCLHVTLCVFFFFFTIVFVVFFFHFSIFTVYLVVFSFQNSPLSSVSGSDCESVSVTTCSLSSSAYTPR